ncbi:aminoglycoside phosphotransferase [Lacihabitans sp. LS3-19]|uniref:phosphotransferase n=1 Tax=Lacihabitans sp. LS3-19 TaxID=2487335 RepID=UPI0020CCAB7E|nr:phosphotransferase [Lacihabitans sp. LS3-19]MCP9768266.1 aminoglycoside phosphotransferase [Lacihabitans sp. LS3-19]
MNLSLDNLKELEVYLKKKAWISEEDSLLRVEKPGEGNMNFTLRVYTASGKTFIAKQSKNYVEKYPSIAAPANRAIVEGRFFEFTQTNLELKSFMPKLLGTDKENNIIITEDLGNSNDFTFLYKSSNESLATNELTEIIRFLNLLHKSFKTVSPDPFFANREMRALNHEHIFIYPFMEENGFDLDTIQPGLQSEALLYKKDDVLKKTIKALGEKYLEDGPCLLHGDYYPGSFLKTNFGVKIIDPEFCFYGLAEFDLGVLIAHLKLSQQSQEIVDAALEKYEKGQDFEMKLLNQFVGVEILRRIIGLAQLPLSLTLDEKKILLKEAYGLIMNNI